MRSFAYLRRLAPTMGDISSIHKEVNGTSEVYRYLRAKDSKIAIGSGFPHKVVENIVHRLKWNNLIDFVSSAEKEGKGRPNPALIQSAMKLFEITDPKKVVKVGDTKMDVMEGKNAGCWTVAVLTGTQTREMLKEENPDFIINSVHDLPDVLTQIQCL